MSDALTQHKRGMFAGWYQRQSKKTKFTFWFVLLWPVSHILLPIHIPSALLQLYYESPQALEWKQKRDNRQIRLAKENALAYMFAKAKYRNPSIVFKRQNPDDCKIEEQYIFIYRYYKITCFLNDVEEIFFGDSVFS